ncbi:MAG: SMC-Scp complex subunit ScpB [Pseudomonadales bacterium]|nr:SMC-Scp complex subunit ScpB [Pseudomonadales bacterium]
MEDTKIKQIIEAALLASDGPLTVANLVKLFAPGELGDDTASKEVREALKTIEAEAEERGVELQRVASGYRFQVRQELSEWVSRLWDEKPPRYTRALLETLALVAYKQPVTRGDIEQVRGVSVSQNIVRTLLEREWIKVVGYKEVPGKPALYATTKEFLDYFNLKSLAELPPLPEIRALIEPVLQEELGGKDEASPVEAVTEATAAAADVDAAEQNLEVEADGISVEPVSLGADVVPLHPESIPKAP